MNWEMAQKKRVSLNLKKVDGFITDEDRDQKIITFIKSIRIFNSKINGGHKYIICRKTKGTKTILSIPKSCFLVNIASFATRWH